MRKALFAGLMCLLMMSYPASARCYVGSFTFFGGGETDVKMIVSSGKTCWFVLHAGSASHFDRLDIPERPKHGSASLRQGVGVDYRANASYKGEDEFVLLVTGVMKSGTTEKIKVHVTIN